MKIGCMELMKFKRLCRRIRALLAELAPSALPVEVATLVVGILERLWKFTSHNAPRGDVGRFSDDDICEGIGWLLEATPLIDLLVDEHWLDRHDVHRLLVHDWHEHVAPWLKNNVQRHLGGFLTTAPRESTGTPEDDPQDAPGDNPEDGPYDGPPSQAKSSHVKPPPPTPSPSGHADWAAVEESLRQAGVAATAAAIAAAQSRGATAHEVQQLVAEFNGKPGAWEGGALHDMVTGKYTAWPKPRAEYGAAKARAASAAAAAARQQQRLADEQQAELRAEALGRLEVDHGAALDALSEKDLKTIFMEVYKAEREWKRFTRNRAKGSAMSIVVRHELLSALAERNGAAQPV